MSLPTRPRPSLAEQAYQRLEHLLVTQALEPGATLREQALMEVTGFGRTPVREAAQRLAAEGLLRVLPRKGMEVTPIRAAELAKILEVRRVLERLLVVKAAERATPDQRRALQAVASHLRGHGDLDGFFRLDRRLDQLLASACRNPHLVVALGPSHAHCRRLWYRHREALDLPGAAGLHASLAEAVSDGDGAGAVRALNGIIAIVERLIAALETGAGQPARAGRVEREE